MLTDKLWKYASGDAVPMHMPGHKRNAAMLGDSLPWKLDITEIDGFDNLHDMQGVLRETAALAARLYGSVRAFPLVGGSTCGILAAMSACTRRGDGVIVARNCHKSVYNAAELLGLHASYVLPQQDAATGIATEITPQSVEEALAANPDVQLVVITSPTYEGVVSDIAKIAETVHRSGALLLVDAAHGAHLGFSPFFPQQPVICGADIVVMSLHKTLPALTQCALLHVCSHRVDADAVARALAVFETSSPSYVLLASIDACLRLLEEKSTELFASYERELTSFFGRTSTLKKISIFRGGFAFDLGKVVISTRGTSVSGTDLLKMLRTDFAIELEMAYSDYAVAMTSICDDEESLMRLADALLEIDSQISSTGTKECVSAMHIPRQAMSAYGALEKSGEFAQLETSAGRMALEYIWAYPPGIPIVVPGEVVDSCTILRMQSLIAQGTELKSTYSKFPELYTAEVPR